MLADHTGLEITFKRQKTGNFSYEEKIEKLESKLIEVETRLTDLEENKDYLNLSSRKENK